MPTRSTAAIVVEPNAPLVIDEVTLPDPQPDHTLDQINAAAADLAGGRIQGRSIITYA